MICRSAQIFLVLALHGIITSLRVDAGRPRKYVRERQSDAMPQRFIVYDAEEEQEVTTPYSATEQEVAHFMSSGGLAGIPPLTPLPTGNAATTASRTTGASCSSFGKGKRNRRQSSSKQFLFGIDKNKEAECLTNQSEIYDRELDRGDGASSSNHVRSGVKRRICKRKEGSTRGKKAKEEEKESKTRIAKGDKNIPTPPNPEEALLDDKKIPFYLPDVPQTRIGRLFHAHEKRYWQMKEENPNAVGNRQKFFKTRRLGLSNEERHQFRCLVRQFMSKLHAKGPRQQQHKQTYRLKRYGPNDPSQKTEAQKKETRLKGRRTYLMRRLRQCMSEGNRSAWLEKHDRMLQEYVAEMPPLVTGDQLLKLYKDVIAANEAMKSCI